MREPTEDELRRINDQRRRAGLPPLTRAKAVEAASSAPSSTDSYSTDFMFSYMTGFPMPSAGGLMGYAAHSSTPSSSSSCDSSSSSSSYDSSSSSSSYDSGSSSSSSFE